MAILFTLLSSNYAFNPIAEQALRSDQTIVPQRVNAALDFTGVTGKMKSFALALICGYQSYLSPYKGFRCALRAHTGCASCSALGYRAIRMKGLLKGVAILRERLLVCGIAHRRYGPTQRKPRLSQRGDCDFGCDDLPLDGDCGGGKGKGSLCDGARCFDWLGCDWPSKDKKRRKGKDEKYIHIPPKKE